MSASSALGLSCRAFGAAVIEPGQALVDHLLGEVAFGPEVEVEAALSGVRNSGDVVQGGMGVPVPIELLRRSRQEGGAGQQGPSLHDGPRFRIVSSALMGKHRMESMPSA